MRPENPMIAAKFATECNIAVRLHVPIFPRWKDYKDKPNIFKNYLGKVAVSIVPELFLLFISVLLLV
jgi:hypothetical protein